MEPNRTVRQIEEVGRTLWDLAGFAIAGQAGYCLAGFGQLEGWKGREIPTLFREQCRERPAVLRKTSLLPEGMAPSSPVISFLAIPAIGAARLPFGTLILGIAGVLDSELGPIEQIAAAELAKLAADWLGDSESQRLDHSASTQEQDLQSRLSEEQERYQLLFQRNPLAQMIVDLDGFRIVDVNPAAERLYGYSKTDLQGRALMEIWPSIQRSGFLRRLRETPTGGLPAAPYRHRRRDGSLMTVEVQTEQLQISGRPMLLFIVGDLSERRALEEQLAHAQKIEVVGRLTASIAHDFNNLLTVIQGYAQLAAKHAVGNAALSHSLNHIVSAASQAALITAKLTNFAHQQQVQPVVITWVAVLANMSPILDRLLGERISLVTKVESEASPMQADAGQLEQIVLNLVINASDAMPDGGTIRLEVADLVAGPDFVRDFPFVSPGRYATLSVSDSGSGMSREVVERIFEPFFTTKEQGKGSGLGLSIIHNIVKENGGHVLVETAPGSGSTFRILLPVTSRKVAEAPACENAILEGSELVLLVEDVDAVREFVAEALKSFGYRVVPAGSGEEALEILKNSPQSFGVLVSDVALPAIGGPELAREAIRIRPDLGVLLISGYSANELSLGARMNFLRKPFGAEELARAVRAALGRGQEATVS